MLHRAGNVDGEGDGCGLLVDIPTKIWAEEVRQGGHNPALALDDAFAVAHVFVERSQDLEKVRHGARELLGEAGFRILAERVGAVDSAALGPTAREEEPQFWQFAGLVPEAADADRTVFNLKVALEEKLGVHVASFSGDDLRLQGDGQSRRSSASYYADLSDERMETIGAFGHNRYSTNTWPSFTRVQPFGVLGHNGEINTIEQLRQEARMLGRADRRGQLGLAGPQPHDRDAGPPPRPLPRRGDGDGASRRSSTRSPGSPRNSTPSTCTCARRWARSPRVRLR